MRFPRRPRLPSRMSALLAMLSLALLFIAVPAQSTPGGTVIALGCGGFDLGQCAVPGDLAGVVDISAATYHSVALKNDGTVIAWGCGPPGDFGQCNVPSTLSDVTAIAAGDYHSLALKSDGTVVAWAAAVGPATNAVSRVVFRA